MDKALHFYVQNELQANSVALITVFEGLADAAGHLHNRRKEEAIEIVSAMTKAIIYLHTTTIQGERIYKEEQKHVTETVAQIILHIGSLNDKMTGIQGRISNLSVDITQKDVEATVLRQHLAELSNNIRKAEHELNDHKRQLNELNNKSAGSIIRSIFCFGLDRLVLAIKSLVDQDIERIKILRDEIMRYDRALYDNEHRLHVVKDLQHTLREEQKTNERAIHSLQGEVDKLHKEEAHVRAKLTAITQIAGFYGKLKAVCESVRKNISWLQDIIDELNDSQPRIVDIDASGSELVPLRTALAKLDLLLHTDKAKAVFAARHDALSFA